MAVVVSLTETKIRELLSNLQGIELSQDEINAIIVQLLTSQGTLEADMDELKNVTVSQLQVELAANDIAVAQLNDTTLPALEADLEQAQLDLTNLSTVSIPALEENLSNELANAALRPKAYRQADAPTDPDIDDRGLIVGDTWFDTDDDNKQYVWNGTEWSTLSSDVADFSLTAQKFKTSTHMIY